MQFHHIGNSIRGFYEITSFAFGPEVHEHQGSTETALLFWEKHGIKATADAVKASSGILYWWHKIFSAAWSRNRHHLI